MPFTDRFIKVPIELIDKKLLEINGDDNNCNNRVTYAKLNPFEISHYHPQPDDGDNLTCVLVYFKSGDSLFVDMTIKEFETLLDLHGNQ